MVTAKDFVARFVEAYAECRGCFPDRGRWDEVWSTHWSRFVLWNPVAPQTKPLMRLVAEKLDLVWWDREPFRLDGGMVPSDHRVVGSCPLPLLVGVEHENDIRTFVQEIVKLGHVICPLKVGVTYLVAGTSPPSAAVIADGQQQIRRLAEGSLRPKPVRARGPSHRVPLPPRRRVADARMRVVRLDLHRSCWTRHGRLVSVAAAGLTRMRVFMPLRGRATARNWGADDAI
jgi:hypothetical protein